MRFVWHAALWALANTTARRAVNKSLEKVSLKTNMKICVAAEGQILGHILGHIQ
jgi:hypothetical protein